MTDRQRNFLAIAVGILLVFFMLLVFPDPGFTESPYPGVPAGCPTPADMLGADWEIMELQKDQTYRFYWFFLKNKDANSAVRYASLVMAAGVDWPVFYNYLENGGLRFLRLTGDRTKYVVDPDVDAEDYNTVARYYELFLGVAVAPCKGT